MNKINEVSRLAGASKWTLQDYDDEDLHLIERAQNNHRVYDGYALERTYIL